MPYSMPDAQVAPSGLGGVEAYLHNQQANNQLGLGYADLAQKYSQDQAQNQLAQQNRADAMTRFLGQQQTTQQQLAQQGQYQQGELANRQAEIANTGQQIAQTGQYQQGELANQGVYQTGELAAKNADLQMRVHDIIEKQAQDETDRINKNYDTQAKNPMYSDDPQALAQLQQTRDSQLGQVNQKRLARHNMAAKGTPWADPNAQQAQQPQQSMPAQNQPPPGSGNTQISVAPTSAVPFPNEMDQAAADAQANGGGPSPSQAGSPVDQQDQQELNAMRGNAPAGGGNPELSLTRPQDPLLAAQQRYQARQKKQGVIGTYQKQLDTYQKQGEGITLPDGTNGADVFEDAQQKLNQILADPRASAQDAAMVFQDPQYQAVRAAINGKVQNADANTFQDKLKDVTSLATREKMIDDYAAANGLGRGLPDANGQTSSHADEMKNGQPENQKADQIVADAYKDPTTGNFRTPDQAAAYIQYQKAKAARDFTKVDPNNPFFQAEIKQIMDSSVRQMTSDTTRTGNYESDTNSINDTLGLSAGDFGAMLSNSISMGNSKTKSTSGSESVGARKVIGMALQQWKNAQPDLKAEAGIKDMTGLQNKLDSAYSDAQDEAKKVGAAGFPSGADDQQQNGNGALPPVSEQNPNGPTALGGATAAALNGPRGNPQIAQRFEQVSGMLGGRAGYSFAPTPAPSAGMSGAGPAGMQQLMQDMTSAPEQGSVGAGAKPALQAEQAQLWQAMSPEQQAFYSKQGFDPNASGAANAWNSMGQKNVGQVARNAIVDTGKTAPVVLSAIPGGGIVAPALISAAGDIAEGKKSAGQIANDAVNNILLGKAIGTLAPKLVGAGKDTAEALAAKYPNIKAAMQKLLGMGMPAPTAAANVAKASQVLGKDASAEAVQILAAHADNINPPSVSQLLDESANEGTQIGQAQNQYKANANAQTQVGPSAYNPQNAQLAPGLSDESPLQTQITPQGVSASAIMDHSDRAASQAWKNLPSMNAGEPIPGQNIDNSAMRAPTDAFNQTPSLSPLPSAETPTQINPQVAAQQLGGETPTVIGPQGSLRPPEGFDSRVSPAMGPKGETQYAMETITNKDIPEPTPKWKKPIPKSGDTVQRATEPKQYGNATSGEPVVIKGTPPAPVLKPAEVPLSQVAPTATPQATAARIAADPDMAGPVSKAQYIDAATGPATELYGANSPKVAKLAQMADAQFDSQHASQVADKVSKATGATVTPQHIQDAKSLQSSMDLGGKGDVLSASDLPKAAQEMIISEIDDPKLNLSDLGDPGANPTQSTVQRVNQGIVPPGPGDAQLNGPSSTLPSSVQQQLLALANRKRAALIASGRGIGAPAERLAQTAAGR